MLFIATTISSFAQDEEKQYYLSTNLISPIAGLNFESPAANVLVPLLSNLEYGFTLSGGYYKKSHNWELRLTAGRSNPYNFIPQIQFGYNLFIIDRIKHNKNGFYIGSFYRWWDYRNQTTKVDLHNMTLNLTTGYAWKKNKFIADIRLNQSLFIYSTSSSNVNENHKGSGFEMNTSPMPKLSRILPFVSINIGFKL